MLTTSNTPASNEPKLLDIVRGKIRLKHYSIRTEQAYLDWIKRFILHHGKQHPKDMGTAEVEAFLTHLAVERHVAASTRRLAKRNPTWLLSVASNSVFILQFLPLSSITLFVPL